MVKKREGHLFGLSCQYSEFWLSLNFWKWELFREAGVLLAFTAIVTEIYPGLSGIVMFFVGAVNTAGQLCRNKADSSTGGYLSRPLITIPAYYLRS
jgi:hypothetical protein